MFSAFFGQRKLTDDQRSAIRRRCGSVLKAFEVCCKANEKDQSPCNYLETSAVSCVSEICCRVENANYERCIKDATDPRSFERCEQLLTKMKNCLKRYGQYPFV